MEGRNEVICGIRHNLTEEDVVRPVRERLTDCGYRDVVNKPHDKSKDGQRQEAVRDNMVNLIRSRKFALCRLLLDTVAGKLLNELVTLVRDDGLGVVIHLLLAVLDVLLDMLLGRSIQLNLFDSLLIALKELDCKPTKVDRIYLALNRLLDMRKCVLHGAGEHMRELTLSVLLGEFETQLCRCLRGLTSQGAHLDHRASQLFGELL